MAYNKVNRSDNDWSLTTYVRFSRKH